MEDILEKIGELVSFADRKKELDSKKEEIDNKQSEIKQIESKYELARRSIAAPALKEQLEAAKSEVEGLQSDYTRNYKETAEEFTNKKSELRDLIDLKLSRYKRPEQIESAKQRLDNMYNEARQDWETRKQESDTQISELESKQGIYEQLVKDAEATLKKMNDDILAGKNIDQASRRITMEELAANKAKVAQIKGQIGGIEQAFNDETARRQAEIDGLEDEINNYKLLDENIDEIIDIEHLRDTLISISLENVSKLPENVNVKSISERIASYKASKGIDIDDLDEPDEIEKETTDEESKDSEELDKTGDLSGVATKIAPAQPRTLPEEEKEEKKDLAQEEGKEEQDLETIKPKIKGIVLGKGITIEYENAKVKSSVIKPRKAKKLAKSDRLTKQNMITDINQEYIKLSDEVLEKMDPNVLNAFQEAIKNGISREDVIEMTNRYMDALVGSSNAQADIKGLITYDRTNMDYWKPSTFLDKIINHKYYKTMSRYMEEAKGFVSVIEDKKAEKTKGFFAKRKIKLLDKGKDLADNAKELAGDTASMAIGIAEATKKSAKVFREEVRKAGEDVNSRGVPHIASGKDVRTEEEKIADEKLKEGNGEER